LTQTLIGVAIGGIFALLGIYMIVTNKMVTIILDKATNKGTIALRAIVGGGTRELELNRVKKLILRKHVSTSRSSKSSSTSYKFIIAFVMDSGEELPFELATISAGITDVLTSPDEKQMNAAKQIATFLEVPFEFVGPPPIGDVLKAMKEGIVQGMERMSQKST